MDPRQSPAIAEQIRRSQTDLLFVAMGSPAQEFWIAENLERTGARFAMGVGGSFDHLSGRKPRAPRWMQRAGLEWAWRIWLEPRRLFWRYFTTNPRALYLLLNKSGERPPRG